MSGERMVTCGICRDRFPDSLATMRPLKRKTRRSPYVKPVCPRCEEIGWQTAQERAS